MCVVWGFVKIGPDARIASRIIHMRCVFYKCSAQAISPWKLANAEACASKPVVAPRETVSWFPSFFVETLYII